VISEERLARLVALYSEFHQALDPFHPSVLKAEKEFFELLHSLHTTHAADLSYDDFRRYAVRRCKLHLWKNQ